ncbi:uncharacterized protein DUF3105 [Haloactinospora alba]|uniref:Uncharacterized protein DUF3105 n=1 Tax=Haloactinospora alba TaxID=405555 RepID=A0A543NFW1_9ACTN|nr:DUF3105 domain-containing protein [Haloactinospora alba]TQN30681.1 uncharacterized protein DUF3105 [Haloactinospora alba]
MSESKAARRRRQAAERKAQRLRQERRRRILTIAGASGAAVLVLSLVGLGVYRQYERSTIEGLRTFDELTNDHVTEPVDYDPEPPVGGDHHAVWQNCGVYEEPVSARNAVHSLEHGAVWLTHEPDLPEKQREELASLYSQGSYVIVSPYDGEMPAPIVASAWGKQLRLDDATDERISAFLRAYERSSDVPEPGAACSNALDLNRAELEEAGGIDALTGGM